MVSGGYTVELTATATDGVEGSGGVVRKGCTVDGRGRVLSIIQWGRDGRDSDSMQRERRWQDGSRCGCSRQIKADFWGGGGGVGRGSVDRRRRGCLGEAMSAGREAQEGGEQWKLAVTATATAATVTATAMAQRQVPGPPRHGEADPSKADKVTTTGRYLQAATCNGPATVPRMEPGAALGDWRLSDGGQCVAAMIRVREQRRRMHERFRTLMHCAFVCSAVTGGRLALSGTPVPVRTSCTVCTVLRPARRTEHSSVVSACDAAIDRPRTVFRPGLDGDSDKVWIDPSLICPTSLDRSGQ